MDMTPAQRLILSNQYQLMCHLDPSNGEKYRRLQTIIERGYALQMAEVISQFEALCETQCREVIDIMEMHHAMQASYNLLDETNQAALSPRRVQFWGFDAATEGALVHYVRFLVDTEGLYPQFDQGEHRFNSQMPMRDKYHRMLDVWRQCPRQFHLSLTEIEKILAA
ncbi:YfbU family protein [Salinivibrio socompensis]|uniref:YfbU family protein n=1 Tax=Salinivibrio socompensis TaxID=1510206 RepID=UPI000470BBED|nr:YfbU family protein [Salinivibrio socompensis]